MSKKPNAIEAGTRIGRLVVMPWPNELPRRLGSLYLCQCDCGEEVLVGSAEIRRKDNCGCLERPRRARTRPGLEKTPLEPGQRFARLVVIERSDERSPYGVVYRCQCDCGKETTAIGTQLLSGSRKSCGCAQRDAQVAFGKRESTSRRIDEIRKFCARTNQRAVDIVFEHDRKEFIETIPVYESAIESVESSYDDDWRRGVFDCEADGFKER